MFWRPDLFPATLGVRVDPVDETANGDVITLDRIHSRRTIAEVPGWGQFAVLDCDRYWVQLAYQGEAPVGDRGAVRVQIDGVEHGHRHIKSASQLLALYRETDRPLSSIGVRRNGKRLEDALLAHDIKAVGGSLRDIATGLYGAQIVERDWNGESRYLKERARRALERAKKTIDGAYLKLLEE